MSRPLSVILVLALSFGTMLAGIPAAEAEAPPLSGTVVKAGGGALAQAEVELLAPGTDRVTHKVYTDPRGRFAFRNLDAGEYDLRIRYGGRVLTQRTNDGSFRQTRVVVRGEPQQLTVRLA